MENISQVHVGVDVSKSRLDIHIYPLEKHFSVANSARGIESLISQLSTYAVQRVTYESSGGYQKMLHRKLKQAKFKVWEVDPKRVKYFIASEGVRAKTDTIDARMIARFSAFKPHERKDIPASESADELRALVKRRSDLVEMKSTETKRLNHPAQIHCAKKIKKHIRFLEKEIQEIEDDITKIVDKDEQLKRRREILASMPGIGPTISQLLVAEIPELGILKNTQIASLVGVAPYVNQSGNYKGTASIREGRPIPRKAIYMGALSASHSKGNVFERFFARLIGKGKSAKVALVALMRKMIVVSNALIRKNEFWNPNFQKSAYSA
ncbi:MAG: transposase [Patescibacteria group bacterium]|nr:transposase [Patescibacteria group bacterium]